VIDRAERALAQQAREQIGVALIRFVPERRLPAAVADDHPIDDGHEQVVQPLRLRAFLERDLPGAPHPSEHLQERRFPSARSCGR
jgi:hypothetical protein